MSGYTGDVNAAEKQQPHITHDSHSEDETHGVKAGIVHEETAHEAAVRGHVATDM